MTDVEVCTAENDFNITRCKHSRILLDDKGEPVEVDADSLCAGSRLVPPFPPVLSMASHALLMHPAVPGYLKFHVERAKVVEKGAVKGGGVEEGAVKGGVEEVEEVAAPSIDSVERFDNMDLSGIVTFACEPGKYKYRVQGVTAQDECSDWSQWSASMSVD